MGSVGPNTRESGLVFAVDGKNSKSSFQTDTRSRYFTNYTPSGGNPAGYFTNSSSDFDFGNGGTDQPFSICFWMQFLSGPNENSGVVVSNAATNLAGRSYYIQYQGDRFNCYLYDASNNRIGFFATGGLSLDGQWHFCVLTYDASKTQEGLKMYVDAVEKTYSYNSSGTYVGMSAVGQFKVGNPGTTDLRWNVRGGLDNLAVYGKELSLAEITTLYNNGNGTSFDNASKTSLISWWSFNETSGNALDRMGVNTLTEVNGNNLTYGVGKVQEPNSFDYSYNLIDRSQKGTTNNGASLVNGAWNFDGTDDYVDFGNSYTDDVKCIDIWFNSDLIITNTELYNGVGGGIAMWDNTSQVNGITIGDFTGNQTDEILGIWNQNGDQKATYMRGDDLQPNTWYNIVINWNGSNYTFYKNGVEEPEYASALGHCPLVTSPPNLAFARNKRNAASSYYYFQGKISQIKIYNRVLTAQEIKDNYNEMKYRFR